MTTRIIWSAAIVCLAAAGAHGQDKVYWTNPGSAPDVIQRADLDGSNIVSLVGSGGPKGIALDPDRGHMYWIDNTTPVGIRRANLDGSNITDIVTSGLQGGGLGIAIDPVAEQIYWTDRLGNGGTGTISRANLDGSGVEVLVDNDGGASPFNPTGIALDLANGKMYWCENLPGGIRRANLDGTGLEDVPVDAVQNPVDIAVDSTAGHIYYTDRDLGQILRADVAATLPTTITTFAPVSGLMVPQGIALDLCADKMYWGDNVTDDVQRANLDGSSTEGVVFGISNISGIALDVAGADPIAALQALTDLVTGLNLQQGIENSLDKKLENATKALDDMNANNDVAAFNKLVAFQNEVEAQRGNWITDSQADELVAASEAILVILDTGGPCN